MTAAKPRTPKPRTTNHDAGITPEFRTFMMSGWTQTRDRKPKQSDVAGYTGSRRAALSAQFPGETLVIAAGRLKVRSNDTFYNFRAASAYAWLTGHLGEGGVLVMTPTGSGPRSAHRATLYVRPRNDRTTIDFFRDRDYGELWVGPRPGVEETSIRLDIKTASLSALPRAIEGITQKGGTIRSTPGEDRDLDELLRGHTSKAKNAALATALSELRLIKDDWEIDQLHQAVNATHRGFNDVIAEFGRATSERWLEGTFFRRARTDGNDIGYGSIVACGHHACTLHWMDNSGEVNDGELALLDMGVEGANLYTADVTRTVPISGTFSDTQRMVYEAVLEAQEAGIAATRAGASFTAPHQAAMRVLVQHLIKWGLLHTDIDDAMRTEMYRRYTLHGTSHMLGIDVHDCAQARNEFYRDGSLQPGMALTVEPGLYFQPDDATVPKHLRGIGVRIEDDVVVTTGDPLVLSAAIPKTVKGVEQWVRSARRRR